MCKSKAAMLLCPSRPARLALLPAAGYLMAGEGLSWLLLAVGWVRRWSRRPPGRGVTRTTGLIRFTKWVCALLQSYNLGWIHGQSKSTEVSATPNGRDPLAQSPSVGSQCPRACGGTALSPLTTWDPYESPAMRPRHQVGPSAGGAALNKQLRLLKETQSLSRTMLQLLQLYRCAAGSKM